MLIKCPECGKSISDRALSCPNCGFPVSEIESVRQAPNINLNVNSKPKKKRKSGTVLPSKRIRIQLYMGKKPNGKRVYKSFTADTAREAQEMAYRYKATHKLDDVHSESFEKAAEHFFTMKTPVLSPSTIRGYRSLEKVFLSKFKWFCDKRIDGITKTDVQTVINELSESVKPKTIINYVHFISSVLALYDIEMPKYTLPQKQKPDLYIPDEDDIKILLEAVEGTDLEIPVLLGVLGPVRRGEIWALTLDDIEGNVVHVRNDVVIDENFDVVEKDTAKNYSSDRFLEFPESVISLIRKKGYVTNFSIKLLTKKFNALLNKAGLRHFRFHDLRHAFVSIAHAHGIPEAEIQRRGGWATNRVMNDTYRHAVERSARETVDKINQIFFG